MASAQTEEDEVLTNLFLARSSQSREVCARDPASMAPAASEEAEIIVAAAPPLQQPPEIEEGETTAHAASGDQQQHVPSKEEEDEEAAAIKEALERLQPLQAMITALLAAGGTRRVNMPDHVRRCLAFVETELRHTVALLKFSTPPLHDSCSDDRMLRWLMIITSHVTQYTEELLESADPQRHTLLRRAARCFRPSKTRPCFLRALVIHCHSEHPCRYRNLLLSSSGLEQPPYPHRVADVGGLSLVGMELPTKKLLRWLTPPRDDPNKSLRVISIVGPAGIGKTTLALELCKQLRGQTTGGHNYFQCNVIAQVSRSTNDGNRRMELLLQDILSQISEPNALELSSDQSQSKTMEFLVRHVSEGLQDKRYFICVDDMWESGDWEKIKGAFPNNKLDSRILITTRVRSISQLCCSDPDGFLYEMKPLNETDSERLLLSKAFGSVDGCLPHNVKLICDELLRRCQGVPLFITGTADWLKEQRQQKEEEQLQLSTLDIMEQIPRLLERFEQPLSLAYYDIPYELRLLCLCMSMVPSGYFHLNHLIYKWTYEGLTEFWYIDDIEDADKESFFQLVDKNVITPVLVNCRRNSNEAEESLWQVNHFMMQFLASKSAEIGFVLTNNTLKLAAAATTEHGRKTMTPRRLALHHPDPLLPSLLQAMEDDLSETRSLAVSGAVSGVPLDKFVNLVVLDLEGWDNLTDEELQHVCRGKMFFLRYLSIKNTRVSKLPPDIKELRSLELLDGSCTQITELPFEMFELKFLRFLDLTGTRVRQLPQQVKWLQRSLQHLLVSGEGRIDSIETAARVPEDIRHLCGLRTLATIDLSDHPASFVKALGDLRWLEVLAITWFFHQCTDRAYHEALLSSIEKWKKLKSLTIHCGLGCSMEFLDSLSRRPKKLEKFKVTTGRFANVPKWINKLTSLSFVQITVCSLVANDLKIFGELPQLQCLILGLDFIPGEDIVIENEGFPELQRLSIDCPLPWLTFRTGAMTKLRYLQLKFCASPVDQTAQTSVPSGICNLRRLAEVDLCYNVRYAISPSVKMTVEVVRKEVAKHRNPIDLFINGIEDENVQVVDEVGQNATRTQSGTDAGAEDGAQAIDVETVSTAVQIQGEIQIENETGSNA
ncbi:hypothetical protein ACP4OV_008906 [Aristida adscensionis]